MASSTEPQSHHGNGRATQVYLGLGVTALGWLTYLVGLKPEWLGLARAPGVGVLQSLVMALGWVVFSAGEYWALRAMWPRSRELPLQADVGARLIATSAVMVVIAALADVLGLGSHPWPLPPSFGPWQRAGLLLGMAVDLLGVLLMYPPRDNFKGGEPPLKGKKK